LKGINGRRLWRRPRPKLGCRVKEEEEYLRVIYEALGFHK
jgi:hypothetical protein